MLRGASGEYGVAADRNSCMNKRRCKNILVVDNHRVDPPESCSCHGLSLVIGFLGEGTFRVVCIAILEVAGNFAFRLWVVRWDELRQSGLWLLLLGGTVSHPRALVGGTWGIADATVGVALLVAVVVLAVSPVVAFLVNVFLRIFLTGAFSGAATGVETGRC